MLLLLLLHFSVSLRYAFVHKVPRNLIHAFLSRLLKIEFELTPCLIWLVAQLKRLRIRTPTENQKSIARAIIARSIITHMSCTQMSFGPYEILIKI